MNELEQLRKEVNELRERLALLESRKSRLEHQEWSTHQTLRNDWLRVNPMPPQPLFISEMAKHFPPGTVLCTANLQPQSTAT